MRLSMDRKKAIADAEGVLRRAMTAERKGKKKVPPKAPSPCTAKRWELIKLMSDGRERTVADMAIALGKPITSIRHIVVQLNRDRQFDVEWVCGYTVYRLAK